MFDSSDVSVSTLLKTQFYISSSFYAMANEDDWVIEKICVSFSLQNLFLNEAIALKIVSFLKPSDLRALILVLQYKNFPVNIYFQRLCHIFLSATEIDELLKHYIPVENERKFCTEKKSIFT
jgi:hypothetical protein